MSRIGKLPITIPANVNVSISDDNIITVKGPKGELKQPVDKSITVKVEDGQVHVTRPNDQKQERSFHGLYRALINNMIHGVSEEFKTVQEVVGVGYKAEAKDKHTLELGLGYSHSIIMQLAPEITVETVNERGKNPMIILRSCDKQLLGQVAAKIRSFRKPEPYKGKGIKFENEILRKKAGKSASAK